MRTAFRGLLIALLLLVAIPAAAQRVRYFGPGVLTPLTSYVPYSGATQDVDLSSRTVWAAALTVSDGPPPFNNYSVAVGGGAIQALPMPRSILTLGCRTST